MTTTYVYKLTDEGRRRKVSTIAHNGKTYKMEQDNGVIKVPDVAIAGHGFHFLSLVDILGDIPADAPALDPKPEPVVIQGNK